LLTYTAQPPGTDVGLIGSDVFSGSLSRAVGENVGSTYTISQGSLINNNYSITYVPANFAITAASLTITASNRTSSYGTSVMNLGNTAFSTSGLVTGDSVSSVGLSFNSNVSIPIATNAGTYAGAIAITGAIGAGLNNYNIHYVNGDLTVNKATLTVTADASSMTYGDVSLPNLSATITGFVLSQNLTNSGVTGSAALSTSATPYVGTVGSASVVGSYSITPTVGSLSASNYDFNYVNGSLVVAKANLSVTASNDSKTYGATSTAGSITYASGVATAMTSGFSANGLVNGDAINSATLSSAGAVNTASIGSASYDIIPSSINGSARTTSANYNITYVTAVGGMTVNKAQLTASGTQVYNGQIEFSATNLSVSGVLGETFAVSGSATMATKNVQTNQNLANVNGLVLTGQGNALLANYEPINVTNTQVTVTVKPVILTAPTLNKVYDGGYTYTMTSTDLTNMSNQLVGGDRVNAATVVFTGNNPNVGANKSVTLSSVVVDDGNGGNNYNISLSNSSASNITPAPLRVMAVNDARFVTQADVPGYGGVVINGFVNGENTTVLSGSLAIARTNSSADVAAGTYAGVLVPSGYTASNYAISYQNGNYTVVDYNNLLVRVSPTTVIYAAPANYLPNITAQYLASDATISNLAVTNSGTFAIDSGSNHASFSVSASAIPSNFSSSRNLSVGGYNVTPTVTSMTGFAGMTLVGSLTVIPKTLDVSSNFNVASISKIYDGGTNISGLNLAVNSTQIMTGDMLSFAGTGTFADKNVGIGKAVDLNMALSGVDANNYVLSSTHLTANTGVITQLSSVAWVGPVSGGHWSNASNWLNGAIPDLNNVAQVIIPAGTNAIYDSALIGITGSAIVNSGSITFSGVNDFNFNNNVSGIGNINQVGVGTLTLSGNNTFTGSININASNLVLASTNAAGAGLVTSNGGYLSVQTGIVLPNLTVNGLVNLASDIVTAGAQVYNGPVELAAGNAISGVVTPMVLSSQNGNITFNSTLDAGIGAKAAMRSLTLNAPNGIVTFNGLVGEDKYYSEYLTSLATFKNIYQLIVNAKTTNINANITTFETQIYNTAIVVGDNGSNGLIRLLLSVDPTITFNGTIDDVLKNTHTLIVKAVLVGTGTSPVISFYGDVGSINPLFALDVETGPQFLLGSELLGMIDRSHPELFQGTISILANISTLGNQEYTTNTVNFGNNTPLNTITLSSPNGNIIFNLYQPPTGGITQLNIKLGGNGVVTGLGNMPFNLTRFVSASTASSSYGDVALINRQVEVGLMKTSNAVAMNESVEVGEAYLLENNVTRSFGEFSQEKENASEESKLKDNCQNERIHSKDCEAK